MPFETTMTSILSYWFQTFNEWFWSGLQPHQLLLHSFWAAFNALSIFPPLFFMMEFICMMLSWGHANSHDFMLAAKSIVLKSLIWELAFVLWMNYILDPVIWLNWTLCKSASKFSHHEGLRYCSFAWKQWKCSMDLINYDPCAFWYTHSIRKESRSFYILTNKKLLREFSG